MNKGLIKVHDVYEMLPGYAPAHLSTALVSGPGIERVTLYCGGLSQIGGFDSIQDLIDKVYQAGVDSQKDYILNLEKRLDISPKL
jgi:hypothetical protein